MHTYTLRMSKRKRENQNVELDNDWSTMDTLTKLGKRQQLMKEHKEATTITKQIKSIEKEVKIWQENITKANEQLSLLKQNPLYKTDAKLKELSTKITELNELKTKFQRILSEEEGQKSKKNKCPVCYEDPKNKVIYDCGQCNNWVCRKCAIRLRSCPMCRCLLMIHPLRRNKALERVFSS